MEKSNEKSSCTSPDAKVRVLHKKKFEKLDVCYDPLIAGSIDGTDTTPHDNAIVRAMNAKYRPRKFEDGNPYTTIFVWKLRPTVTESYLREKFSVYGKIANCKVVRDVVTGTSKGYAFVEYINEDDAYTAYIEARNITLDGQKAMVDFERGRTLPGWKPRRLGGGFGGRKESGQLRFGGRSCPIAEPITIDQYKSSNYHSKKNYRR
ncbi:unnamed protein product [Bemisia tabaci]|uniref:U11/U12 small nuclear ribonucleoprotein 35 kDa protein n=1 Tax=Bemisia tabaci TaxID=7038 RepID=A0A9P0A405_BEMTA|nr:unnamed protein product [Bemisia tabaci]